MLKLTMKATDYSIVKEALYVGIIGLVQHCQFTDMPRPEGFTWQNEGRLHVQKFILQNANCRGVSI